MIRRTDQTSNVPQPHKAAPATELSGSLQRAREVVNKFISAGGGNALFGAGKPALVTKEPPKGELKKVEGVYKNKGQL